MKNFRLVPFIILAIALLWYAALVTRFPTAGAIGDDPATYVQMALDLAQRGSVVHEFPLFTRLFNQNLSWDAFITPGYHIVRETGIIAPNFAFGFPLLLAAVDRVFGENALYYATPWMGAFALIATYALGNELLRDMSPTSSQIISTLAVLILAAAPKQIQLALVPMSDVPAQLFCVLALWCALRVRRETRTGATTIAVQGVSAAKIFWGGYAFAALCGLLLGMAYLIRHSALALVVPLGIVAWHWGESVRQRVGLVAIAALALALVMAPDVFYRAHVLGNVFAVESPESAQVAWLDVPRQLVQTLGALFSVTGFGPLILFVPSGWWLLAREKNSFAALVLAAWAFGFMLLHAPLKLTGVFENSLRYLIPAYPALALSASAAVILLVQRAGNAARVSQTRFARQALGLYAAVGFTIIASGISLRALPDPERFAARAYGWMSADTRRDFETLNAQLPPNAVLGVPDQIAGATLLFAQREIFRPANFLEPAREFTLFLERMRAENRAVYILGDWNCAPTANANERLPGWLEGHVPGEAQYVVRDLPFDCPFPVQIIR